MEVILLEDVKNVGKKGEVVKVNDGFARNVLLKKKQALEATGKNLNDLKLKKANDDKLAAEHLAAAQALGKQIGEEEITIAIKVGEGGKSFGSVSSKEIAEEVKNAFNIEVDRKKMSIADIKNFGEYEAEIKLYTGITAKITVKVTE